MKVLFTCQPASGHLHPLLPLAQTLTTFGHQVAFACAPSFCQEINRHGFQSFSIGRDWLEAEADKVFPELCGMSLEEQPGWFLSRIFADKALRFVLPDLITLGKTWQPDVVVRDYWEFGGYLMADYLHIPHATAGLGNFLPLETLKLAIGPQLDVLRRKLGLSTDPELSRLYAYLYLHFAPDSYLPSEMTVAVAHSICPVIFDQGGQETLPMWSANLSAMPIVYVTLGTIFNKTPEIFERILDGLKNEQLNLVLTVGRNRDPADLGTMPNNVYIERYIPQTLLLPQCSLVISHGGYNTVMGSLSYGLPQLIIPLSADQPFHAKRCTDLGVALTLAYKDFDGTAIREAVHQLLSNPNYRAKAQRIQHEIHSMAGNEYGMALLIQLASEKQPIFASTR
jgi:UDP:flavonoid glycosyltransferase YjiC (YdhE family)